MGETDKTIQRWRVLRGLLIEQLDMFESGALQLRTAGVDVSSGAITDLKRQILEFDALLCADATARA